MFLQQNTGDRILFFNEEKKFITGVMTGKPIVSVLASGEKLVSMSWKKISHNKKMGVAELRSRLFF